MKESIGSVIKESVRKSGYTQEEFAKEMGMTLRNLANLLNKEHLPIDQIIRASKILNEDFIRPYTEWLYEKEPNIAKLYENEVHIPSLSKDVGCEYQRKDELSISLNIKGELEAIKDNLSDFLDVIKKEAEDRGLHLA